MFRRIMKWTLISSAIEAAIVVGAALAMGVW